MVSVLFLSGLAVLGCKDDKVEDPLYELIGTSAVGVQVGSAAGIGEVRVPIRVINEFGAAVEGDAVTVSARGNDSWDETLSPDGLGIATLTLEGEPQAIEVEVTDGTGSLGDPATSWILGGDATAHGLDWLPVMPVGLDIDQSYAAEGGVALIADQEVWWQPTTSGVPAQHMVTMSDLNRGAWEIDIDADGLPDLALWNDNEIILLRGHARAGYVWGWGAKTINGAGLDWLGIGDADGDNIRDVVMLLDDSGEQKVQVLSGDGVWGFDDDTPILLPDLGLTSVAAGIHGSDGQAGLLVMSEDQRLRQYALTDGEWGTKGSDISPNMPDDAYLAVSRDITGDGADEALVLQPPVSSGMRDLVLVNYGDGPTVFSVSYETFREGFGDVTGDGVDDILLSEGGDDPRLGTITVKDDGKNFTFTTILSVATPGPMAGGDFNGDNIADLALYDGDLRVYPGRYTDEGRWEIADPSNQTWDLDALGPLWFGDVDEDGRAEVVGVRLREERATLSVFSFEEGEDGELQLGTDARADVDGFSESGTATATDVAACASGAYAIVTDGGDNYLVAIPISGGGTTALSIPVNGDRVTCGDFGGDLAIAVNEGSGVTFYDVDLTEIQSQSGAADDLDEDGSQGLGLCEGDCTVEAADLDGDGDPETLTGGESPSLAGWGESWPLEGSGDASFFDLDDDGWLDSVLTEASEQRITVAPTLSGHPGPVTHWTWNRDFVGAVQFADVDGDGRPEALVATDEGQVLHTAPDRE